MDHLTFLKKLPKTETHLHLEAALPYSFLQELDAEAFAALPASWDKNYRYESFDEFSQQVLLYAGTWFTSIERYRQAARATFAGLIEQNVRYLEVSVTSGILEYYKLDPRAVLAAVREEVPEELEVRLFMGIHHTGYTEAMGPLLDDSVTWPELDGYDLQGKEDVPVGDWAPGLWQRAREHGKFTKAHAGELCGPKFIRWVLDEMGVQRLEHGVRAIEDQALVRRLSEENIVDKVHPQIPTAPEIRHAGPLFHRGEHRVGRLSDQQSETSGRSEFVRTPGDRSERGRGPLHLEHRRSGRLRQYSDR